MPTRRTALPETKAKLPGVQELWTLVTAVLVSVHHGRFCPALGLRARCLSDTTMHLLSAAGTLGCPYDGTNAL